jgi:hypothetical protein
MLQVQSVVLYAPSAVVQSVVEGHCLLDIAVSSAVVRSVVHGHCLLDIAVSSAVVQ